MGLREEVRDAMLSGVQQANEIRVETADLADITRVLIEREAAMIGGVNRALIAIVDEVERLAQTAP